MPASVAPPVAAPVAPPLPPPVEEDDEDEDPNARTRPIPRRLAPPEPGDATDPNLRVGAQPQRSSGMKWAVAVLLFALVGAAAFFGPRLLAARPVAPANPPPPVETPQAPPPIQEVPPAVPPKEATISPPPEPTVASPSEPAVAPEPDPAIAPMAIPSQKTPETPSPPPTKRPKTVPTAPRSKREVTASAEPAPTPAPSGTEAQQTPPAPVPAPPPAPEPAATAQTEEAGQATGLMTLKTMPYARVYLGKQLLGSTPLFRVKMPAGRSTLRLVGPDNKEVKLTVDIKPGEHTPISKALDQMQSE